ncbi:hypothetical protein D9756_011522 [Leucocoprinus leucothites]|uniref:Exonuclease domain-containing protein n=1 Tax=Leucocoprinus leucothites TaxID=201217 RepID=A0A8H5CNC9_9AGAR|nr:hypothetical protein D9756_011522 [Leucoagaricus leucothites]
MHVASVEHEALIVVGKSGGLVWDKIVFEVVCHEGKGHRLCFGWYLSQRAFKCSSNLSCPSPSPPPTTMRYIPLPTDPPPDPRLRRPQSPLFRAQQPYEAFLILDVEATCFQGTDFNYPNEIIDRDRAMRASKLQVVDEFRSFVQPSWRPTLSGFCTELTGITQDQVDAAPPFPEVLKSVRAFLVKNGLIDDATGKRLVRFCWCSDGPFDIRDFVVKQCFISKISMPEWLTGDVLDVRMTVMQWLSNQPTPSTPSSSTRAVIPPIRRSLNIPAQLKALGLPTFQGRQHSGIDDTRNIAKIVTELGKRGVSLKPNTQIKPGRKWVWMGKGGEVLEQFCASFDENGSLASLPPPPQITAGVTPQLHDGHGQHLQTPDRNPNHQGLVLNLVLPRCCWWQVATNVRIWDSNEAGVAGFLVTTTEA